MCVEDNTTDVINLAEILSHVFLAEFTVQRGNLARI